MNGIESLSTLLAASQEKQAFHQENKVESPSSVYANPGAIGPAKVIKSKTNGKKEKSTDIWEESEIEEMEFDQDPRITPEYQISYLQKVSSEDMFLGMSGKTPSFSHTDDIQVSITLPDANSVKDITLNITKNLLEVMTSKFKLTLHLPSPVKEKDGRAKFLAEKKQLIVVLPILHEFPTF